MISQNWSFDITNSYLDYDISKPIMWYHKLILWYLKIHFVILQNGIINITIFYSSRFNQSQYRIFSMWRVPCGAYTLYSKTFHFRLALPLLKRPSLGLSNMDKTAFVLSHGCLDKGVAVNLSLSYKKFCRLCSNTVVSSFNGPQHAKAVEMDKHRWTSAIRHLRHIHLFLNNI